MVTQITITAPISTDTAVAVTVQQFQNAGDGPLVWVDIKPTVVLEPGASLSEYVHRTQRIVIGEIVPVEKVETPAVDAPKVQDPVAPAPADFASDEEAAAA